jgi:hypothetical protein
VFLIQSVQGYVELISLTYIDHQQKAENFGWDALDQRGQSIVAISIIAEH